MATQHYPSPLTSGKQHRQCNMPSHNSHCTQSPGNKILVLVSVFHTRVQVCMCMRTNACQVRPNLEMNRQTEEGEKCSYNFLVFYFKKDNIVSLSQDKESILKSRQKISIFVIFQSILSKLTHGMYD